jgi:beta-glucosidase
MKNQFIVLCFLLIINGCKKQDSYKNEKLPVDKRIELLLNEMSIDEKIAQLSSVYYGKSSKGENAEITFERLNQDMKLGIGQVCQPGKRRTPEEIVILTNKIQSYLKDSTRLGIPALMHEEGLHGMIANNVSSFPTPIAMACSWNPALMEKVYTRIGNELAISGIQLTLSPVLDVAREPRWGRFEETFGEDPYLVSRMGVAAVKGFQGDPQQTKALRVIATGKHFCGYAQPENGTNIGPAAVTENDLWNIHLRPFRDAISEAGLLSIMPSYNEINGIPSHRNKELLTDILRNTFNFKGIVVADYGGVYELIEHHKVAADNKEAALLAFNAGVDFDLPNNTCYKHLKELYNEGKISEKEIDEKVKRVLALKFKMGLFDNKSIADAQKASEFVGNQEGIDLVYEIAKQSAVLLKNNQEILPVDFSKIKKIGVIGPNADECILGAYYGTPSFCVSPLNAITKKYGKTHTVNYSKGCNITLEIIDSTKKAKLNPEDPDKFDIQKKIVLSTSHNDQKLINEAIASAKNNDINFLFIGGNMAITGESFYNSPRGDRANLELSPSQKILFQELTKLNKPLVVVLIHGGPIADEDLYTQATTILDAHYLGQIQGDVIIDMLDGTIEPSGKLAYSVPLNVGQIPVYYNYKPSARRGYGYESIKPAFPFGFGLSYTSFDIEFESLSDSIIHFNDSIKLYCKVTNTGKRNGTEVVQLYIRDEVSSITRPVKELIKFQRVNLEPNESKTIAFTITQQDLAFYNEKMKLVTEQGYYTLMVGNSSITHIEKRVAVQ